MRWKWCRNEMIISVVIPVVFIFVALGVKMFFFEDNAFPRDYDNLDSYEWAHMFMILYSVSSIICMIFNLTIPVLGTLKGKTSCSDWMWYLVYSLTLPLTFILTMVFRYPEDSSCQAVMIIMFISEYLATFFLSTYNCPKHWNLFPKRLQR